MYMCMCKCVHSVFIDVYTHLHVYACVLSMWLGVHAQCIYGLCVYVYRCVFTYGCVCMLSTYVDMCAYRVHSWMLSLYVDYLCICTFENVYV